MRTKAAKAPDRLTKFLETAPPTVQFNRESLQKMLGLNKAQTEAVILYGLMEDKFRVARKEIGAGAEGVVYELSSWRKHWATKPWNRSGCIRE